MMLIKIDKVHNDDIDIFQSNYYDREIPAIVIEHANQWRAFGKWDAEYLKAEYGNIKFPISNYQEEGYQHFKSLKLKTFAEFFSQLEQFQNKYDQGKKIEEKDRFDYIAGCEFLEKAPALLNDIDIDSPLFRENYLNRMPKGIKFPQSTLFVGNSITFSPLHTDSFFVTSTLTVIKGKKIVRIVSPEYSNMVENGMDLFNKTTINKLIEKEVTVWEGEVLPGEVVIFPPGWWHCVRNEGITIAVQRLYVDQKRFPIFQSEMINLLLPTLEKIVDAGSDILVDENVITTPSFDYSNYKKLKSRYRTFINNQHSRLQESLT